jgi:hypothetical protein
MSDFLRLIGFIPRLSRSASRGAVSDVPSWMVSHMSQTRLSLLPSVHFTPLLPDLRKHLSLVTESINADNFASLLDEMMRGLILSTFERVNASEGSIWLHEKVSSTIAVAFNSGSHSEEIVGRFRQPDSSGIISMVFANELPFVENRISEHSNHDKTLDSMLNLQTQSLIATPFQFLSACRGVISCVQLQGGNDAVKISGFNEADLSSVRQCSIILGRLIDATVLKAVIGMT